MLIPNWKPTVKKSWTVHAGTALAVLLTVQATLPQVAAILPPNVAAIVAAGLVASIPVLRLIKQSGL